MFKKCIFIFFCLSMTSVGWCADTAKPSFIPETSAQELFGKGFENLGKAACCLAGFVVDGFKGVGYVGLGTVKIGYDGVVFAQKNPAIVMTCVGIYFSCKLYKWCYKKPKDKSKRRS